MKLFSINPINFYVNQKKKMRKERLSGRTAESVFTEIYQKNLFKGNESRSGTGSNLKQTEIIRRELPNILNELKIQSMLDIPCGDFFWLKEIDLSFLSYIGADIVDDIISSNNKKYAKQNRNFIKLDILEDDLPKVDLILCRDLLVHISFNDIKKAVNNIKKSQIKYILTTSFPNLKQNNDIITGDWRKLNLQIPPISFPNPMKQILEKCTEKNGTDKSLLLYQIKDL